MALLASAADRTAPDALSRSPRSWRSQQSARALATKRADRSQHQHNTQGADEIARRRGDNAEPTSDVRGTCPKYRPKMHSRTGADKSLRKDSPTLRPGRSANTLGRQSTCLRACHRPSWSPVWLGSGQRAATRMNAEAAVPVTAVTHEAFRIHAALVAHRITGTARCSNRQSSISVTHHLCGPRRTLACIAPALLRALCSNRWMLDARRTRHWALLREISSTTRNRYSVGGLLMCDVWCAPIDKSRPSGRETTAHSGASTLTTLRRVEL
jgi:hypothetical protein